MTKKILSVKTLTRLQKPIPENCNCPWCRRRLSRMLPKSACTATKKYGDPDNWKTVDVRRYIDALLRHTLEFVRKLDSVDSESGIAHYKHMACNMAFICEMMGGGVPQQCKTVEEILAREG